MPEIIKLGRDDVITEPGFYEMPLEQHHNQPCDGPSVTSGVLRTYWKHGPHKCWSNWSYNPNRKTPNIGTAARMGTAMASMIEGGLQELSQRFVLRDENTPRQPTAAQRAKYEAGEGTEAGIRSCEFWDEAERLGKSELNATELQLIADMSEVLANDPGAKLALEGAPEVTMAWRDEITGLWLLARPDTVNFTGSVTDYKKMNTNGFPFDARLVNQRIEKHGYHMQIAFGAEGMEALTEVKPNFCGLICQEDEPGFDIILHEIDDEALGYGRMQNRYAIDGIARHLEEGSFPSPNEKSGTYMMSDYYRERTEEKLRAAGMIA